MKRIVKILSVVVLPIVAIIIGIVVMPISNVKAAETCDPQLQQDFLINRDASDTEIVSFQIANTSASTLGFTYPEGGTFGTITVGATGEIDLSTSQIYHNMGQNGTATGSFLFASDNFSSTDKIVIRHNNAATYKGEPVDIIVTYSDFTNSSVSAGPVPSGVHSIEINKRFYAGVTIWGVLQMKTSYQIMEAGTNSALSASALSSVDSAFVSIASLNEGEFVAPVSGLATPPILATGTVVTKTTMPAAPSLPAWVGDYSVDGGGIWVDVLGSATFNLAAAQLPLTNSNPSMYIGSSNNGSMWFSPTTALVNGQLCPKAPEKAVDKDSVNIGTDNNITYTASQRVQQLGTEIFGKYSSFVFTDTLDSRLTVDPAQVVITIDGTNQTSSFTINYDAATHTLTSTANAAILASNAFYGSNVVVTIPATTNVPTTETFLNKASFVIDNYPQFSNEVETKVLVPILQVTKTTAQQQYSIGEVFDYVITVKNVGNFATPENSTMRDAIPGELTLQTVSPEGCAINGQNIECSIPAGLAPGADASWTVKVKANAASANPIDNTAKVTGGGDPVCVEEGQTPLVTNDPTVDNAARCSSTATIKVIAPPQSGWGDFTRNAGVFLLLGCVVAWLVNRQMKLLARQK